MFVLYIHKVGESTNIRTVGYIVYIDRVPYFYYYLKLPFSYFMQILQLFNVLRKPVAISITVFSNPTKLINFLFISPIELKVHYSIHDLNSEPKVNFFNPSSRLVSIFDIFISCILNIAVCVKYY